MPTDLVQIALATVDNERVLLCDPRDLDNLILPGGKHECGESDEQTIVRELREELGPDARLRPSSLRFLGRFVGNAAGRTSRTVEIRLYGGAVEGNLIPAAEIVGFAWVDIDDPDTSRLSPVLRDVVFPFLREYRAGRVAVAGFVWAPTPPGFVAGYSTRSGGVSAAPFDTLNLSFRVGDDQACVLENRSRLAATIGIGIDDFVFAQLAHGSAVVEVSAGDRGRGARNYESAFPATDSLITATPGVALAVNVADCVPIILIDSETPAVGVVHAGWRGTLAHIAAKSVAAMGRAFATQPHQVSAFVAPSIAPESCVVSDEVAAQAIAAYPHVEVIRAVDGMVTLDLRAANVADLKAAGVRAEAVRLAAVNTYEARDLYSARRESPTGRFAAVSMIAK
jgi:polyphenol oxidase